ncbi:MAG: VCBS repeat-containing protein [Planctomycetota bacterium]|nr:MAG: VCBS repeat-containing protein [Planctomycetota bacterium]
MANFWNRSFGCLFWTSLWAWAGLTLPLSAQGFAELRRMLPVDPGGSNSSSQCIALGDVDGDGDLDAFLGIGGDSDFRQNQLWLNDGHGLFEPTSGRVPAVVDSSTDVVFGDIDGDQDLDLFVANPDGLDRIYWNDGSGFFTASEFNTTGRTHAVILADFDLDGDLDAFLAKQEYWLPDQLLLNDGSGNFSPGGSLPPNQDWCNDVAAGDLDHDGDVDLLLGNGERDYASGINRLYLNDGSGHFLDATAQLPSRIDTTLGVELVDVDGDGDLDAYIANVFQDWLFLNDGSASFSDSSAQIPADPSATVEFLHFDPDQDQDQDLFLLQEGQNRLLQNDGSGYFHDASDLLPATTIGSLGAAAADVDGDQDLDLLQTARDFSDRLFLNDGSGRFFDVTAQIHLEPRGVYGVDLGDVDGDGDLDAFLAGGWTEQNWMLLNDGTGGMFDASNQIPASSDHHNDVLLRDFDGDGDLDAVIATGCYGFCGFQFNHLFLNDGTGFFHDATDQLPADWRITASIASGDVDSDGDLDLFLANDRGQFNQLYLNDGQATFTDASSQIPLDGDFSLDVALGDVDGDGDLDAVLANAAQNRLYLNDGAGSFQDRTSQQMPPDNQVSRAVVLEDFDLDGDLDLFFGNRYLADFLYLNDGQGSFTDASSSLPAKGSSYATHEVTVGDFDLDGDPDLFLNTDGWNRLWLNDGQAQFQDAPPGILPADWIIVYDSAAGDLDGDHDLDLLLGMEVQARLYQNLDRQLVWKQIPRIEKPLSLVLFGPPFGSYRILASRNRAEIEFPPYGTLWIDPAEILFDQSGSLDGEGQAQLQSQGPISATLQDRSFYWQALIGHPWKLSNLERTTFSGL